MKSILCVCAAVCRGGDALLKSVRVRGRMLLPMLLPLLGGATLLHAQSGTGGAPGDLDTLFGGTGKVIVSFGTMGEIAEGVAALPDGRILLGGYTETNGFDFALARLLPDGTLDPEFGSGGKLVTDFGDGLPDLGRGIAVTKEGRIVVVGQAFTTNGDYDFGVAVYLPDGQLDTSFNGSGLAKLALSQAGAKEDVAFAVAVQPDGKIVVAGRAGLDADADLAVVRYLPDGTLDPGFNGTGMMVLALPGMQVASAIALQPDGRIVLAGSTIPGSERDTFIVRLNADGTLDPDFNAGGTVTVSVDPSEDFGSGVLVQPDGRIVVSGAGGFEATMLRLMPDGSMDASFGSGGIVFASLSDGPDDSAAIVRQSDGKLILAGLGGDSFGVGRFEVDGSPDLAFGNRGSVTTQMATDAVSPLSYAFALALQNDGKIVVSGLANNGGDTDMAVARYLAAGNVGEVVAGPLVNPANGHTYYLLSADSWTASEARAQALGGHLATVDDATENQWLVDKIGKFGGTTRDLWIGLNDAVTEGTLVWSSRDPVGYTNWATDQPDNGADGLSEDFVRLLVTEPGTAGQWSDEVNSFGPTFGVVEIPTFLAVVNTGGTVPNEPDGTTFVDFGSPAIDAGRVGGLATIQFQDGTSQTVIFGDADGGVIARVGDRDPAGAIFVTLGDPIFAGEALGFAGTVIPSALPASPSLLERFSFLRLDAGFLRASLRPAKKPAALAGLYSRLTLASGLQRLAVQGGDAPEAEGGTFSRFSAFGLPRDRGGLVYAGLLKHGGEVSKKDDFGVWRERTDGTGTDLLFRNGRAVEIRGGGLRSLKRAVLLGPVANAPDQRRSFAPDGGVAAAATFADGAKGILTVDAVGIADVPVETSTPVPDLPEGKFTSFGTPATASGERLAFLATVRPKRNQPRTVRQIFTMLGGPLRPALRQGDPVPGMDGLFFGTPGEPLLGQGGVLGLITSLKGKRVSAANRKAIVLHRNGANAVVARLGSTAPDVKAGAKYKRFLALVVTDTPQTRLLFTATLSGPGITAANNTGLWCVSPSGTVKLLLRTGGLVTIGDTPIPVRTFDALTATTASRGQGRTTDAAGFVSARVKLGDGRSGVLRIPLP